MPTSTSRLSSTSPAAKDAASASPSFADLGVPAQLVHILTERGIHTPTPIQAATLRDAIGGRDVLGRGRTGSGKTYAFLLPLVTRLSARPVRARSRSPRAVILAPTRELVTQIDTALQPLAVATGLRSRTVFGGVSQVPQTKALQGGVDIVVACPGRLEDLVQQGACRLDAVEITVLDEADHMADLGFLPGVTRLLAQTPQSGQRLFFSATLDKGIDGLVKRFLTRPARHEADSPQAPVTTMDHHVLHVRETLRADVLADLAAAPGRTVIFTRTKYRAKSLTRQLNARGVPAVELHGNLSQNARTRSMDAFHEGRVSTLVATDIAARGIHVDNVELVIHADPPVEHKAYVHRSGRTARAGSRGTVVTMMTDAQVCDVRALTKAAGVRPSTTVVDSVSHPILQQLAAGERSFGSPEATTATAAPRGRSTTRPKNASQPGRNRKPNRSTAAKPAGDTTRRTDGAQSRRQSSSGRSTRRPAAAPAASRTQSAADFSRRVRTR
nr:DEAD/DEAH box helicase [Microlunatus phosphovorus]